jgi:NAD(P)H-nitrite reductase large subunit
MLRNIGPLAQAAAAALRLRRAGVPITFATRLRAAQGDDRVTAVALSDGIADCDVVATCFGFLPQSDLPRQVGCAVVRDPWTGGWTSVADDWMRSTVAGVSVAGETTGVAGAEIALREGRIAGIGIARDAGRIDGAEAARRATPARRDLARLRRFARMLADIAAPGEAIAGLADDDTIICRCEDVTRGQIVAAMAGGAAPGAASALKLMTRAGMGVCQGRSCEHAVMALVAAETGTAATSGFTARYPVRPVAIGDLI